MRFEKTNCKDLLICRPQLIEDSRGYFYESFNLKTFEEATGLRPHFVQDNQSQSAYGVVRGLHYQVGDNSQAKLVRVLEGRILDVVVDLRKEEKTFGEIVAVELSADNKLQLYIPRGFAHGFSVLSPSATFFYKCDNYYHKPSERGISAQDKTLSIDWGVPKEMQILSEKDSELPSFGDAVKELNRD